MAIHSSTIAWKIPRTDKPGSPTVHEVAKSQTRLNDFPFHFTFNSIHMVHFRTMENVLVWLYRLYMFGGHLVFSIKLLTKKWIFSIIRQS